MNEQEAYLHATPDLRAWSKVLAGYREPSNARSALEILITVLPLVLVCTENLIRIDWPSESPERQRQWPHYFALP